MAEKIKLTKEGYKKQEERLRFLIDVERENVKIQLAEARAQGDLSENADYDAARNKQAAVEGRIKEIEDILANAKIISVKSSNKVVNLGNTVTFKDNTDGETYSFTIVGTIESNPMKGLISNVSPLGKAVMGKKVGDVVTVQAQSEYTVEILKIESQK
jgi:transcription elongation factor GreA